MVRYFSACLPEELEDRPVPPLMHMYNYLDRGHPGTLDAAVHCVDQCDGHPNLYVSARLLLGMLPLFCELSVYDFKRILRLRNKESVHRDDEWIEVTTLPESSLQVIFIFLLLRRQEELLRRLVLVR